MLGLGIVGVPGCHMPVYVVEHVPEARDVHAHGRELAHERRADARDVLVETQLTLERQAEEMLVMVLEEADAVAAIRLLVGEEHVRFSERCDELRVLAAPDALDAVAREAAHVRGYSQRRGDPATRGSLYPQGRQ